MRREDVRMYVRHRVVVFVSNRSGMPSPRRVAMASGAPSIGSQDTVRTPSMSISRPSIATTTFALTSFGWPLPEARPELGD